LYLVSSSARTVTVCRVITYAPGRALFPPFHSYISKATTLPRAGFLPSFHVNADPVKSLHVKFIRVHEPIPPPRPCLNEPISLLLHVLSFISWLQASLAGRGLLVAEHAVLCLREGTGAADCG